MKKDMDRKLRNLLYLLGPISLVIEVLLDIYKEYGPM